MTLKFPVFNANVRIRAAANNNPWMKRGERGPAVAILQGALIDVGHKMPVSMRKGVPDGIYGKETRETVYEFQVKQKLKGKDGVAGKDTINRLDQLLVSKWPKPSPKPKPKISPPPIPKDDHYKIGTGDPHIKHDTGKDDYLTDIPASMMMLVLKNQIENNLPTAAYAIGPDAVRHMRHYFKLKGPHDVLRINLERMIQQSLSAKVFFDNSVSQAKDFVENLPVGTHNITSKKVQAGGIGKSDSKNWYFAVHGYSAWGKGVATVTNGADGIPARTGRGNEFELEFEYKFEDYYNWDKGKSTSIGGIEITDEFMGDFHRQGLAREFKMVGSIKRSFKWKRR